MLLLTKLRPLCIFKVSTGEEDLDKVKNAGGFIQCTKNN